MKAQSGIYLLLNRQEMLCYIGSSSSIKVRFARHIHLLNRREHDCKGLQAVFNRHGREGLEFIILEEVCQHDLLRNEMLWITAALQMADIKVANKNKSYGRSIGKISGKPIQSRIFKLQQLLNLSLIPA